MKFRLVQTREPYSGSFSGSFIGDGSQLTGVGSSNFDSSSLVLTSSFNLFTQSIHLYTASAKLDSASFDSRINLKTDISEFRPFSQSIHLFTASVIRDSASFDSRINTTNTNLGNYTLLTEFRPFSQSIHLFTASVVRDSASFDSRINNKVEISEFRPFSQSIHLFTASAKLDSASFDTRIDTINTNLGNYTQLSLFYNYTSSTNQFTSSVIRDSASFDSRINSISTNQSNYTLLTEFRPFSQSIHNFTASVIRDSASFDSRINNKLDTNLFLSFSQSIHNYTASNNLNSASFESTIRFISGSYVGFTQSYYRDSASFDTRISALSGGGITEGIFNPFSQSIHLFTASVKLDSASFDSRINLKTDLTEFRSFSQSIHLYTASVKLDSASFDTRINTINTSLSNYTLLTEFRPFSQSIHNYTASAKLDSASFDTRINSISSVSAAGQHKQFQFNSASIFSGSINLYQEPNQIFITGSFSGSIPLLVKAAGNQVVNTFNVKSSTDTDLFYVSSNGFTNYLGIRAFMGEYIAISGTDIAIGSMDGLFTYNIIQAGGIYGIKHRDNNSNIIMQEYFGGGVVNNARRYFQGNSFFGGSASATAFLHIEGGNINTASIKINTGSLLSSPENGAMEYDSNHLYFTIGLNRLQLDGGISSSIFLRDSASFDSRINLKTDQTVFVAYSQSINLWTASINDKTASFATTGSNIFIGSQTITGSVSISGSLIIKNTKYENAQTSSISGSNTIISTLTSSYNAIFYNYLLISASNLRAGQIMAVWNGSTIQFNEVVTNDIGNTSTASFSVAISASYVNLVGNIPQSSWTIKTNYSLL